MTTRTTETTVTFTEPFTLRSFDGVQPASTYRLVTDEEEIQGLSFLAYRRVATMLHTPCLASRSGGEQVLLLDPMELDAALEADAEVKVTP
jgi:hypothetical protein